VDAEALFRRMVSGGATAEETELFRAQMLTEMARMSLDDGLVMQIHPGSRRNHNAALHASHGRDKGADIPGRTDYVAALKPLLDRAAIAARQVVVHAFASSPALRKAWAVTASAPDLETLAARLGGKAGGGSLADLQRLYRFAATTLPAIGGVLRAYDGAAEFGAALADAYVGKLAWAEGEFAGFKAMCEQVVEDLAAAEPRVAPTYDDELRALADERADVEGDILAVFNAAQAGWARNLDGGLKCQTDKVRGYVFRTRPTNEKTVRATPGTSVCQVLKDGLYFTTLGQSAWRRGRGREEGRRASAARPRPPPPRPPPRTRPSSPRARARAQTASRCSPTG
jgi:hypothetical protein